MSKKTLSTNALVVVALALAVTTVGCAGRSAPATFYTLSALPPTERTPGVSSQHLDLALGVGPASFPEFLDRPQIVTRLSSNRLQVDEFHRWGGPLKEDFLRVLGENLATLLGTSGVVVYPADPPFDLTHSLLLSVQAYEGKLGESVSLVVGWALVESKRRRALLVRRSRITEPVASSDYEALVAAQSRALAALSREIAEAISGLVTARKR